MPFLCRMPWAPCNGTTSTRKVGRHPPNHSTLQWHPAMAPSNGTTSTPASSPPTIAHYNGTPAMAPRPLPQSWLSPSPQPYHTTMAPYDGTQQWHHVPQSWSSTPSTHTTMAMCNGTQQWHHVLCTLQWHPGATSNQPKWFVALPPIGSKNPYSYRYLGKNRLWSLVKNSGCNYVTMCGRTFGLSSNFKWNECWV